MFKLKTECLQSYKLQILVLKSNEISSIQPDTFSGLGKLQVLDLSSNRLYDFSFSFLADISLFYIGNNTFGTFNKDMRDSLGADMVLGDDFRICCLLTESTSVCSSKPVWPHSCKKLLNSAFFKAFILTGFICIVLLNILSLIVVISQSWNKPRVVEKDGVFMASKTKTSKVFFTNTMFININDLLFASQLISLLFADNSHGEMFVFYAKNWLSSVPCKALGFLSTFVLFESLFLLNLISVSRFVAVKYPFSNFSKENKQILRFIGIGTFVSLVIPVCILLVYQFAEKQEQMPSPGCLLLGETRRAISIKLFTGRQCLLVCQMPAVGCLQV